MGVETAEILSFIAFGAIWLFPVALIIAVLGFSSADAKSRIDDPGPNVVLFPEPSPSGTKPTNNWLNRIKRLAFRVTSS